MSKLGSAQETGTLKSGVGGPESILTCPECAREMPMSGKGKFCQRCGYHTPEISVVETVAQSNPFVLDTLLEIGKGFPVSRSFLHACLRHNHDISGVVLDLGGGRRPSYLKYLPQGDIEYIRADGDPSRNPDIILNLEARFPISGGSIDTVLLFNVLEHLFDFENCISECHRILKPGGTLIVYVPCLVGIHGSPYDYFRYTHFALHRLLSKYGFSDCSIIYQGGLFVRLSFLINWSGKAYLGRLLLPVYGLLWCLDALIEILTRGKYRAKLPAGYFVTARKPAEGSV